MLTQSAEPKGQIKVVSGQAWKGTNGYGTVKIYAVTKKDVLFYPEQSSGVKCRKSMSDFLRDFVLVV